MKLRAVLLFAAVSAAAAAPQPAGWVVLFSDDFETAANPWRTWGAGTSTAGWRLVKDGANTVYEGQGHIWLGLQGQKWSDFRFRSRVKLLQGGLHINYRVSGCSRYFLGFNSGPASVSKQAVDCSFPSSPNGRWDASHVAGRWYDVEIVGVGGSIKFYEDGALKLEYADPDPLLMGGIAFEALPDSRVQVDDVEISGPPPPVTAAWVKTGGPIGGLGYDVRMRPDNPGVMFVTDTFSGVNKSVDGGRTWFSSNAGITTRAGTTGDFISVFCLTIDPTNPDVVWAGTQNARGIFRSADGGKGWAERTTGIVERSGISFRGITVDPRDPNTVYAAAEISSSTWAGQNLQGREFDMTKGVVYRTRDAGLNWTAIWRGDNLARYIWIDPRDSNVLYVSTGIFDREAANSDLLHGQPGGVGILKTTDGGQTWQALGAPAGLQNLFIGSLFLHPRNPDILLAAAGVVGWAAGSGIYISTDAGLHWSRGALAGSARPIEELMTSVEFALSDPRIAYAAGPNTFYRSDDGGLTWTIRAGGPPGNYYGPPGVRTGFPIDLQVDPRNPDRIFINNYGGGNFLSEDGGRSWQVASNGYTGATLRRVAVDPRDEANLYVIGRSGPFRSPDRGGDWIGLTSPQAASSEFYTLALDPSAPDTLLIADEFTGVLLRSNAAGRDWRLVFRHDQPSGPDSRHGFKTVVYAPSSPRTIYAGMANAFRGLADPAVLGRSYGVFKSLDGGLSWNEANDSLSATQSVNVLAVDPRNESFVYAGTVTGGLLKSADGGRGWQQSNQGLPLKDVRALALDPGSPWIVYAGLERGGVYKSLDGGATWQAALAGMDPTASVRDIVIDPANPQVLFAADVNSGVYRSGDAGKLWVPINKGLSTRTVVSLALSADGGTLYAATEGEGVFRLDLAARGGAALTAASAASFAAGGALAPDSIASVFGGALAEKTEAAPATNLPAEIGGTSLTVVDAAGVEKPAPLFFVSPDQVNFLVPAGLSEGPAVVRVLRQARPVARGATLIASAAPGIFTASANGQGVPAALATRYGAGGAQTAVPVFQCGAVCTPVGLDLGAETDQLILMLYGTGFRNAKSVSVSIGGVDAPVLGFAAQSQYPGLDQVNVRIPRELKGRGDVDLLLKADGKTANAVKVRIQ